MQRLFRSVFIGFDWLTAALSWALFYYYRKTVIEHVEFQYNETFYYGIFVIPILWLTLYAIQGTYIDIRRLYRLKILSHTTFATIFGSIILFFTLLLDDEVTNYHSYYRLLLALTILHFGLTFVVRIILTSIQVKRIHSKKEGFRTRFINKSSEPQRHAGEDRIKGSLCQS